MKYLAISINKHVSIMIIICLCLVFFTRTVTINFCIKIKIQYKSTIKARCSKSVPGKLENTKEVLMAHLDFR